MKKKTKLIQVIQCVLTAHRIEFYWHQLRHMDRHNSEPPSSFQIRKKAILQARIKFLSALYFILTEDSENPEKLAI